MSSLISAALDEVDRLILIAGSVNVTVSGNLDRAREFKVLRLTNAHCRLTDRLDGFVGSPVSPFEARDGRNDSGSIAWGYSVGKYGVRNLGG